MSILQLGGSKLEELADEASTREALGGFNLRQARNQLAGLLSEIGRTQEFSTYTKHDISHIDALLRAADWIIPPNTFPALTVADALVTVLAIYVHDLGMLVTKDEFAERDKSGFPGFKDSILGDESARGVDFRDRLSKMDDENREHFLYEEFVRVHHAERIESWILGKGVDRFGVSSKAAGIVREVLAALPTVVRNDVAVVAKSHHSDDIYDTNVYQLRRVYGNHAQDVDNLQYAAIVLRTVDLLHITKDRTPTIQYRLSTPVDPMGQREWRKQAAVRAVVGHITEGGEPVIEVHASFDEPVGYFALMSYLDYCDAQLSLSRKWVEQSAQKGAGSYEFPWVSTVREQIETLGFLRHQLRFTFDQQKVLELLTGHTLYNDASVAIRELVQNSIDAVRLRKFATKSSDVGAVKIEYDTASRRLRVRDDGVGMTQATLENHFLRVGSSSYQSKEFKDRFPEFASISRFGIGVLSAFMIADEVRVATRSSEDSTGRQLVLNSVHGRYLIRDLDEASEVSSRVGPHGTEIELQLRPSSELSGSMIDLLRRWILLPGCAVTCTIDGDAGEAIGWQDVSAALEGLMEISLQSTDETRVVTKTQGGTTIAVAEVWNEVFKEWDVVHLDDDQSGRRARVSRIRSSGESTPLPLEGISIQGIRVTDGLPGWRSSPLVLVDVSGDMAPRTNVARTDLEAGPPLDALTERIFEALVGSIEDQIEEISVRLSERLALKEVRHLFRQMVTSPGSQNSILQKPQVMRKVLEDFKLHPVEVGENLSRVSAASLRERGFTVLVGPAADDAVRFMDWLPTPRGMLYMLRQGGFLTEETAASSPLLGGQDALFAYNQLLWDSFEVSKVRALEGGKSLLLDFVDGQSRWIRDNLSRDAISYINQLIGDFDRRVFRSRGEYSNVYCIDENVEIENLPDGAEVFFVGRNRMFSPKSQFVKARLLAQDSGDAASAAALYFIAQRVTPYKSINIDPEDTEAEALREFLSNHPPRSQEMRELLELLLDSSGQMPVWSASYVGQRRSDTQN